MPTKTQLPTLTNLTLVVDTTHHYRPRWAGFNAQCRLRIWRSATGEHHIVMLTELPTNTGISITNYSENLATEIRRQHGLDLDTTIWIEHWPVEAFHGFKTKTQFDLVRYTWTDYQADDPHWQRLDPAQISAALDLSPIPA